MWGSLRRGFAAKTVSDPRYFPTALQGCRKAGEALDLYLNSTPQFQVASHAVPLLQTLAKLRLPKKKLQVDFDCLSESSLLSDARFKRLTMDLGKATADMSLQTLLDTYTHFAKLYGATKLPEEVSQVFLARLQALKDELRTSALLQSKALRLCATALPSTPSALARELLTDLAAKVHLADAETVLNTAKALVYLPNLRSSFAPRLQTALVKSLVDVSSFDIGKLLLDAERNHMLSAELLEEGMSVLVGRLYSQTPSEVVQTLRVHGLYVAATPQGEVGRIPDQCARAVLRQLRSCSAADVLYLVETLPQYAVSTASYYELLSVEVVRHMEDYSLSDTARAVSAMGKVGLESSALLTKVVERLRLSLKQEAELVVRPDTHEIMAELKAELLPELARRKPKALQLSLSDSDLIRLLWGIVQMSVRIERLPLHGEEWKALIETLEEKLKSAQKLPFPLYEEVCQVAWFTRMYFPTFASLSPARFLPAFDLDTRDTEARMSAREAELNDIFCRSFLQACREKQVEGAVPGYGLEAKPDLFHGPSGVFVNALVDDQPVLLVQCRDFTRETGKLRSLLSLKLLILQTTQPVVRIVHFEEWKAQFEAAPDKGDKYIEDRLEESDR